MKGRIVIDAIENGLSKYPKYEGRFPCVSGLRFKFDPEKPAGKRILMETLTMIDGRSFEMNKDYVVVTKQFMAAGKDAYTAFIDPTVRRLPPNWGEDDRKL